MGTSTRTPFVALLKACAQKKDLCKGTRIHADILQRGLLAKDPYAASALVNMYAKCGALAKAQQVLDELPVRDVVSWSALIAGYAQQGQGKDALNSFDKMQREGISPNAVTFICALKACARIGAVDKGKQIHEEIINQGLLGNDVVLGNTLVDMYAKCGLLAKAQQVLSELPVRDIVSWNALIAGYAQQGQGEEALNCFQRMQGEGLYPDKVTFSCILKACGSMGAVDKGTEIHEEIVCQGLLGKSVMLGTALVDMYAKCGAFTRARQVLDEIPVREVVLWNALISGYAQQFQSEEALDCFDCMQREGLSPNTVTFICTLKACGNIRAAAKGKELHDEIARLGILEKNIVLGNALVDMYAKCGELAKAQQVLDELPSRDLITWNALIAGYAQQEKGEEALNCFDRMQREGLSPNVVTLTCILKTCGSIGAAAKGKLIHDEIVRRGFLGKDVVLGTALVDMYAKCGMLVKAQQVLDELPFRNVVSWSALIAGYAQQGEGEEALNCFERMQRDGYFPNAVTFICILKACGCIGAADKGKQIHEEIASQGLLGKDVVLGNALVDMYAKCGVLTEAQLVLDELPVRNVVAWNALIAGYAQQVQGERALHCFEQMQFEGLSPDAVTFISVLNACSRSGLVDKGHLYVTSMSRKFGIAPSIEHHTCMVDLFCRTGQFDKAISVIIKMPSDNDPALWSALLCACRKWGNMKLGKWAFKRAVQVDKFDAAAYVFMANIYAAASVHEEDAIKIGPVN